MVIHKPTQKVQVRIDKSLYKEIMYAMKHLQTNEDSKIRKRKERITFLYTTYKLGKYLNTKRKSK